MNQPLYQPKSTDLQNFIYQRTISTKRIQTLNIQRLQKYVLSVQNDLLKKQIEIYEWRQKTDFPIIKIQSFKLIEQKLEKTHLEVILNSCYLNFTSIKQLKVQDVTFLIKEAFIGFERLFNKFRSFVVSPEMIVVDQKGKCKVWINSNFSLNQVQKEVKQFNTFYRNIVDIFQKVTLKNSNSVTFYQTLKRSNCFLKGLKFIQDFVKNNNIKITPKSHLIKKVASTPNFYINKVEKRLYPIEQEQKNLRQTIGCLRKRQQSDLKNNLNQAMTFAGKNARPLQKRLQQMIKSVSNNQISQKNNLVLNKLKYKTHENGGQNLKKVFKSIKDFKFRKPKQQEKQFNLKHNFTCHKSQALQNQMGCNKIKPSSSKYDLSTNKRSNNGFSAKNIPQNCEALQDGTRFSVTQTRTSFFNSSGQKCWPQQNWMNSSKKFGSIKFSEISNKKNSQISEFNKDIENILFGIDEVETIKQCVGSKRMFSDQNISSKSLHENDDIVSHNISILEQQDVNSQSFKKVPPNNLPNNQSNTLKSASQIYKISSSPKYGQILDQIQQPTAQQLTKKYIQLGWKPTLNILNFDGEVSEMKASIHGGDDQCSNLRNCQLGEKKPIKLGKLDKIKNRRLAESVMDEDFFNDGLFKKD